jgi:ribose 5-phosphate isomerase A
VTAGVQILQNLRGAWMLRRDIEPGGAQLHGDAVFARFAAIPDVVEHGLFLNGIDTIVIARGDTMEVRRRGQVSLICTCAAWMTALTRVILGRDLRRFRAKRLAL